MNHETNSCARSNALSHAEPTSNSDRALENNINTDADIEIIDPVATKHEAVPSKERWQQPSKHGLLPRILSLNHLKAQKLGDTMSPTFQSSSNTIRLHSQAQHPPNLLSLPHLPPLKPSLRPISTILKKPLASFTSIYLIKAILGSHSSAILKSKKHHKKSFSSPDFLANSKTL